MKKEFNITGVCIHNRHYMVNISNKIEQIEKMIEDGKYFVINRPRQYGKTTTLNEIANLLREKYIVLETSFEGIGDNFFNTEEMFCSKIIYKLAMDIRMKDKETYKLLMDYNKRKVTAFDELSYTLTDFIESCGKEVILLIDEVDKNSTDKAFLQFLGMLRNKYLAQSANKDISFKSVILSGVHDIKNLKLAIRNENDTRFNSPWNIASKFKVDMSFNTNEIKTMLVDYKNDHSDISFNEQLLSAEIYKFTSGYPYLVSDICKIIDEDLNCNWSIDGVHLAVKQMLGEKATLFDDVIKNLENNQDIKDIVIKILLEGQSITYNPDAYEKAMIYGILSNNEGKMAIHNKVFEERIYNYLLEQENNRKITSHLTQTKTNQFINNGLLNMEHVLIKFKEFMYEEYRKEDEKFYESYGRLLFLAYLKPIINGKGFSFVEAETRENKRMDIVITYGDEKHIVELKLWKGQKAEEKGIDQLCDYLDIQLVSKGYLIIFNSNKNKKYSADWIRFGEKDIFEVIV